MAMGKSGCMVFVVGVVVAVVLQCAAAETVHVVGDSLGWVVPSNTGAYDTWSSTQKFAVDDILIFNFTTGEHDVLEVPKESYDACTSDNAIGTMITIGPANITISTTGNHYYICTIGQHCQLGQKLSITVSGSSTSAPSSAPSPTTTPPPPPPQSSSSAVFATFFLTLLSVATTFFL